MIKIVRPFSGSHWSLFVGLILAWFILACFILDACSNISDLLLLNLVVILIIFVIALWKNHILYLELRGTRKFIKIITRSFYDSLILFLICNFLGIFLLPGFGSCYTPRAKVVELLIHAKQISHDISWRYHTSKSLTDIGSGLDVEPAGRVAGGKVLTSGKVLPDGTIIVVSEDPPALVILRPTVENDELKWSCFGVPENLMPRGCREPLAF